MSISRTQISHEEKQDEGRGTWLGKAPSGRFRYSDLAIFANTTQSRTSACGDLTQPGDGVRNSGIQETSNRKKISGVPDVDTYHRCGTLQQWRSIHAAYRVELQRLQHRVNFIIEDIGNEEPGAAGRQSTDDLQGLHIWIISITRDMDPVGRSCSAEATLGFQPASDHSITRPCCLRSADRQAPPIRVTVTP